MNIVVGKAEVAYVVPPGSSTTPVAELEHALLGAVAERLDAALAEQLSDSAAVICLRHVHVDVQLPGVAPLGDDTVRAWAWQLAAGIRRAADRDDEAVVFPDESCYWADLLADLTAGRTPAWYQHAHANLWVESRPNAVADVLDRSGDPGAVLRCLDQRRPGALAAVLDDLPDQTLAATARQVLGSGEEGEVALTTAALTVADRLGLWSGRRWTADQVRAAGVRPAVADWRSTHSLTASVLSVVAELVRLGVLTATARVGGLGAELAAEAGLSWLDQDVLAGGLRSLSADMVDALWPGEASGDGPDPEVLIGPKQEGALVPGALAASDRQERLAADIARIVADERVALRGLDTTDSAALFLAATLSARFPQWRGDALVGPMIRRTVVSWKTVPVSGGFDKRLPPLNVPETAKTSDEVIPMVGEDSPRPTYDDEAAGLLLLLRAVVDLRLPTVIRRTDDDPDAVPSALMAAAHHLFGVDPMPAAAIFAGLVDTPSDPERLSALTAPWTPERRRRLARELENVLRAQGLDAVDLANDHGVGAHVAEVVIRAWRRWLGGLGRSSTGYLLTQFLRRPGRIEVEPRQVLVTLAPRPLDVVLEQAGYLLPLRNVVLLGRRDLFFRTGE